jgi:hypothetical protein
MTSNLLTVITVTGDGNKKPSSAPSPAQPTGALKINVLGVDLAEQGRYFTEHRTTQDSISHIPAKVRWALIGAKNATMLIAV